MYLGERNWTQVAGLTQRVVVLPLASFEQHGHHLPLLTDTMVCEEIVRRAEAELGDAVLFLPTLWPGVSEHHLGFAGTISISQTVYADLLIDMVESLVSAGFRRIFLLNAHGGNTVPGHMAVYEVQMRHRSMADLWLAIGAWWGLVSERLAALEGMEQPGVIHACEMETSAILCLRPELVRREAAHGTTIPFASAFYSPDFSRSSRVEVPRDFAQLSVTGAFGYPEKASADKGERVLSIAVEEVVAFLREFATWPVVGPE